MTGTSTLGVRDQKPMWEDIVRVPAQDVQPHPDNPRLGDVDTIRQMIRSNGWHGVLVVQRSTGYILVGNHRYRAGLKEGMDTFPVHYVDVDDEQAKRILLADNRASDLATYDENKLLLVMPVADREAALQVLQDPAASPQQQEVAIRYLRKGKYEGTGYTPEDVVQLGMDLLPPPPPKEYRTPEDMAAQYENTSVRQIQLIMSIAEYEEAVPAFKKAREAWGMDTNTDVVLRLLREAGFSAF